MQLKFSKANAKTERLEKTPLKKWLQGKRKIYSLDLLSGFSCPGACDCLSKVVVENGKKKIKDGPNTQFRCFSASQEVVYTNAYNLRKHNFDVLRKFSTMEEIRDRILADFPKNAGIIRLHVAGDIFSRNYFDAICEVAKSKQDVLIYGYTKSLRFWTGYLDDNGALPDNFILTASYGGRYDDLIDKYKLRTAKVVFSTYEARKLKLPIDHTDEHAANPAKKDKSFALLLHGTQPKNSKASKAWERIKETDGGYSRK